MQFHELALILERLESISARNQITMVLGDCFKLLTPEEAKVVAYMVLGEVGPTYAGLHFNIAEKGLLKMVASLYGRQQSELKELLAQVGDLGSVVHQLGSSYQIQAGIESFDTSVLGVYKFLLEVQAISGVGAQEKKEHLISRFVRCCDGLSLKFLFRIILSNLRLGFSDMTLLDVFSYSITGDKSLRSNLEHAFNVCVDVGVIIEALKREGIAGVRRLSMRPGIPVRPSAAERLSSAKAIIEKLGVCVAQPKLDGFRLQVHIVKNVEKIDIHFFSRNMQDMSSMFPDLRELVAKLDVQSCIFEGEAIAFDHDSGAFLPFQETVKRKRKHGIDDAAQEYPLKLFAFDLLYVNGKPCLDDSHHARRKKLGEILSTLSTVDGESLLLIEEITVSTPDELENYFYKNIAHGLEGLVVKREDAVYMPGKRNFNWIKLKRQETGSLDDTIDCVILGYYTGSGKRAKFGMGALLVGVYDSVTDMFQTVAKIGTGMSDIELVSLRESCDKFNASHRPTNVECSKDLEPDVWVEPRIVCMIRADEITFSPAHKAAMRLLERGLALRFPRFMGLRPDKTAIDATTVEELVQLFKQQKVRKE